MIFYIVTWADPEGGGAGAQGPPEKYKKNIYLGFLSNTGPHHLENYKTTKPAFNVGPLSAHQLNAIEMAFRWRNDNGPLLLVFGSSLTSSKKLSEFAPPDKTFYIRACVIIKRYLNFVWFMF